MVVARRALGVALEGGSRGGDNRTGTSGSLVESFRARLDRVDEGEGANFFLDVCFVWN